MPEWPCEGRFKISVRYANTRLGINYESRNVARPLRCAGVFAASHITYATRPKATLHSRLLSWLRGLRNENNAKPVSVSWLRYVWLVVPVATFAVRRAPGGGGGYTDAVQCGIGAAQHRYFPALLGVCFYNFEPSRMEYLRRLCVHGHKTANPNGSRHALQHSRK